MQLPFGLGAYSRLNDRLPPVRLVNMFAESAPTSKTGFALIQRPGLAEVRSVTGTVRGLYRQSGVYSGDLFTVAGTTLYREGTAVSGTVAGSDLIEWTYTIDGFRLVSGGDIYYYNGTTVAAEAFPDSADVASLTSINDIIVAVRADVGKVYFRLPGDTSWNALDFFSAEREPDPALAVRAVGDELWVFGTSSIECFATTGDDATPFQRIPGRTVERGVKSRDSIVQMDNSVHWTGEDDIDYRYEGGPVRVSNHGIEDRIGQSATATAWSYVLAGHTFRVLNLDDETLAYDVATGEWHNLKLYGQSGFVTVGIYDQGQVFLGGAGKVWTFEDRSDDAGEPLERIFTSIIPAEAPLSCDALEVEINTGSSLLGAVLQTRWSDDGGRTFGDYRDVQLGAEGRYRVRARYRRCGMVDAPGRINEHQITDDAPIRVCGVTLNPALGGRSR